MIDPTITIGNMIEAATVAFGGLVVLLSMNMKMKELSGDIIDMKKELQEMSKIITKQAVQDIRLTNIEQDIRELKHGEGFVLPLGTLHKSKSSA